MNPDDLLTGPQVAALLGIKPATWRAYVQRGQGPRPDDPDADNPSANRRAPRWRQSTVNAWQESRRGQAWRAGSEDAD